MKKFAILFSDADGAHVRLLEGSDEDADRATKLVLEKYADVFDCRAIEVSGFAGIEAVEDEVAEYREDLASAQD